MHHIIRLLPNVSNKLTEDELSYNSSQLKLIGLKAAQSPRAPAGSVPLGGASRGGR